MINIQTGDKVLLEPHDNMGIALKGPIIGIVEKIGRKYIHIRPNHAGYSFRFRREDGKCIGEGGMMPQWILHLSQQDYDDAIEARSIIKELRELFTLNAKTVESIPLENLRKILMLTKEIT